MNRTVNSVAGIAALMLIAGAGSARAQLEDRAQYGRTAVNPSQSMTTIQPDRRFDVFGIPFGVNSPVAPPYDNSAYTNFAGQPQTRNSTLNMTVPQTYWAFGRAYESP